MGTWRKNVCSFPLTGHRLDTMEEGYQEGRRSAHWVHAQPLKGRAQGARPVPREQAWDLMVELGLHWAADRFNFLLDYECILIGSIRTTKTVPWNLNRERERSGAARVGGGGQRCPVSCQCFWEGPQCSVQGFKPSRLDTSWLLHVVEFHDAMVLWIRSGQAEQPDSNHCF